MLSNPLFVRCGQVIVTSCKNPFLNLAKELCLLYGPNKYEKSLFLWQNSPTVVIGKHQNPYKECNLEYMNKHNITLARRCTGGGAVYQDLGNTNWTFVDSVFDPVSNTSLICSALSNFGVIGTQTGRNDVEVNGRKVSGSAFRKTIGKSIHHGTLLVDVNLDNMNSCLSPDNKKLEAKGVDSVRSRVLNLKELSPEITHSAFCEALIGEFRKRFCDCSVTWLDEESLMKDPDVRVRYETLVSREWLFGSCSSASITASKKFDFGLFDVIMHMEKGGVKSCKVHSDCLYTDIVEELEQCVNAIAMNYSSKERALKKFVDLRKTPKEKQIAKELAIWISQEMKKLAFA